MEHVLVQISASALMVGSAQIAESQYVHKHAFIMEIAPTQIHAHAKEGGEVMIVQSLVSRFSMIETCKIPDFLF